MKTWDVFKINYSYNLSFNNQEKRFSTLTYFIPLGLDYQRVGNVIGLVTIKKTDFDDKKMGITFLNVINQQNVDFIVQKNNFASVKIDKLKNPLGNIDKKTRQDILKGFFIRENLLDSLFFDDQSIETLLKIREKFDQVIVLNNEINLSLKLVSKKTSEIEELVKKIEELDYLSKLLLDDNQELAKQTDLQFQKVRLAKTNDNVVKIKNDLRIIQDIEAKITKNYKILKSYNLQLVSYFKDVADLRWANHKLYDLVIQKFMKAEKILVNIDKNSELKYLTYCLNVDETLFDKPNYSRLKFEAHLEKQSAESFDKLHHEKTLADQNYDELINRRDDLVEYDKLMNKLIK